MKHKPYTNRHSIDLIWSRDFGCFIDVDADYWHMPTDFWLGERWVYTTPGYDRMCANFRGNLSDSWPCIDFDKDLEAALEWLHKAKRRWRSTKKLWVKTR